MKKNSVFLIPFLLLLIIGCREGSPEGFAPPAEFAEEGELAVTVTPEPTRPVQNNVTILADGEVKSAHEPVALAFETGGKLVTVAVSVGDAVQAGDVVATLDDTTMQEAIANAELQVAQSENGLAQSQLSLDNLLNWEPDPLAVAQAEANIAAAEAGLANAESQDAAAVNGITQARVSYDQAVRNVEDAQRAYDTAHDPARDWELNDPFRSDALKAEREGTANGLQFAQEQLQVAGASLNLAVAGVNNDTAVSAQSSVVSARAALDQALLGPKSSEIEAVALQVRQAEIGLEQSELALMQAQERLSQTGLVALTGGVVMSVDVTVGAFVGAGSPIVTVWDTSVLEFHTTNLSERDLAQVAAGQPVAITLKSFSTEPLVGMVVRIGLQASGVVGDSAVFPVIIGLDTGGLDVRPGMTGRAEIVREN